MPKIDFTDKQDEFEKWITNERHIGKYFVYVTERILDLRPTISTSTYDDATIRFDTKEAADRMIAKLKEYGCTVFDVFAFYWQSDRTTVPLQ